MRKIMLGLALLGMFAAACGDASQTKSESAANVDDTRFEVAWKTVHESTGLSLPSITLADEGTSIIGDGPADGTNTVDDYFTEMFAILTALDTPSYVVNQMEATTSLMGLREADWDGIHAEWSYHPDNGFDVTLVDTEA